MTKSISKFWCNVHTEDIEKRLPQYDFNETVGKIDKDANVVFYFNVNEQT